MVHKFATAVRLLTKSDVRRLLNIEVSYKYTYAEAVALFHLAGFRLVQHWTDSSRSHYVYLVEKPRMWFPATKASAAKMLGLDVPEAEQENDYGVPTLQKWEEMWRAWDGLMVRLSISISFMGQQLTLRLRCAARAHFQVSSL